MIGRAPIERIWKNKIVIVVGFESCGLVVETKMIMPHSCTALLPVQSVTFHFLPLSLYLHYHFYYYFGFPLYKVFVVHTTYATRIKRT